MSEPVDQTDDEPTTEDVEGTTTDAFDTDVDYTDAPDTDAPSEAGKTTDTDEETIKNGDLESPKRDDVTSAITKNGKTVERPKKRTWMERCMEDMWTCEDTPLWRVYMKTHAEDIEELERADKFKRRKPANLQKFPRVKSEEDTSCHHKCLPLGALQHEAQTVLPDNLSREKMIRIWRNMRADLPVHESNSAVEEATGVPEGEREKWPGVWPCATRDLAKELKERRRGIRGKRRDVFPCDRAHEEEPVFDEPKEDFADRKELGHARIPATCPRLTKDLLVDRAAGEQPGLVDGDYVVFELPSKTKGDRVYADVCLRGLNGMHLPELGPLRSRRKTWKFCFYQAVVALLAKTQLRYKYAWSANIDYVYDHAWLLFTHIGTMNVKEKQRLDDIVVYNYKYSVEVELLQELQDIPVTKDVSWEYEEANFRRKITLRRPELMAVKLEIGTEKISDQQAEPVHNSMRKIERWFDELPSQYRNCILRTTRFSLAFWKDGLFWYLYNPYRCDEFGYWNDDGYACIMKFCTKESLRRHLMILLLRAYVYSTPKVEKEPTKIDTPEPDESTTKDATIAEEKTEESKKDVFTIQIFHMIYHCCQIHNLRLLQKGAPPPRRQLVKKKTIDDCPFDPLDFRDPCTIEQEEDDLKDAIEKPTWLKLYKVTWAKCLPTSPKKKVIKDVPVGGKMRWHQYLVEESNKLFSLWGEIHITDGMFERENRGMQTYACYVVCAGMTRIMAPEYWSSKTLDVIVMCGDRYYTHSKLEAEFKSSRNEYSHVSCWSRYLMSHFKIGETMFEANVLPAICGRLYSKSSKYLWQSLEQMFLKYQFGILTCESSCLGVFKFCGSYYMLDVNSLGPPLFQYGQGSSYLMRATYFYKFLTTLILSIGSPECSQFSLNPIEILKVVDVGPSGPPGGRTERKDGRRAGKAECPFDEEKKKQMRKWKHRRAETARTIDKTCCKGNE